MKYRPDFPPRILRQKNNVSGKWTVIHRVGYEKTAAVSSCKGGFVNYNMKKTSLTCVYNTLSGIFFNKD